jgi:hypothetical protein
MAFNLIGLILMHAIGGKMFIRDKSPTIGLFRLN